MPGLNRTGPMGAGPMTGGRRGICGSRSAGVGEPEIERGFDSGRGMAYRRGFGGGRGRGAGRRYGGGAVPAVVDGNTTMSKADEMAMLRADANAMKSFLEEIQKRIDTLATEQTR